MEESHELETLGTAKRSSATPSDVKRASTHDRDKQDLARVGKRQVLKVRAIDSHSRYF